MRALYIIITTAFLIAGCAGTEDQTSITANNQGNVQSASSNQEQDSSEERTVSADNQLGRDQNIVALAQFTPELSTFFELIRTADLTVVLEGPQNYTVFAPTNDAFNALPAGALNALKDPANKDELTRIIRSHLLENKVLAADLRKNKSFKTMLGKNVNVEQRNGTLMVGKARVIRSDIDASNGVVHIIDSVLIPPKEQLNND